METCRVVDAEGTRCPNEGTRWATLTVTGAVGRPGRTRRALLCPDHYQRFLRNQLTAQDVHG